MMRRLRLAMLLLIACSAGADDVYEVLRRGGEGYAEVVPGKRLEFPRDHLPHPDYRIEWWYLTANLADDQGRDWGVHWTLFRQALNAGADPGGWISNQVWMAHAALSTPAGHIYEERFARGGIGQAGVAISDGRFDAWLDDWQLRGEGPEPLPATLTFKLGERSVRLQLYMDTPWVLQGDNGYSLKSAQGQASYYYSQPHIRVTGAIRQDGRNIAVSGAGWLDREWSSQPLADNQPGWDWFSLHLQDGSALMVYRLRHDRSAARAQEHDRDSDDRVSGTWIDPDGSARALSADEIRLEALAYRRLKREPGMELPLEWSLALPHLGADHRWIIRAQDPEHWLATAFPYWEGPVVAEGSNPGVGYMELTGYR